MCLKKKADAYKIPDYLPGILSNVVSSRIDCIHAVSQGCSLNPVPKASLQQQSPGEETGVN